jgi:hypothetical protein
MWYRSALEARGYMVIWMFCMEMRVILHVAVQLENRDPKELGAAHCKSLSNWKTGMFGNSVSDLRW